MTDLTCLAQKAHFNHSAGLLLGSGSQVRDSALMSRIEREHCLINTSYLAALFNIFVLLHI